jgi:hypothetical protein
MFRSVPKRAVLAWLIRRLGPPPAPPRRYFTKSAHRGAYHRGLARSGRAPAQQRDQGDAGRPGRPG